VEVVKPVPILALTIVFVLAFAGGLATVAFVAFVLVPLWAVATVARWAAERHPPTT
jgi:hypothetical protein